MSTTAPQQKRVSQAKASPQALAARLRTAGLRPTRQRVAIAALLLDGRHRHITAESLSAEIATAGLRVADATVYNVLNQFTDAGLLRRVMVRNDYSLFDTNTQHHHHFYAADRDQLTDIPSDDVVLAHLPDAPDGHEISSVDVVIHIQSKPS
jgi:Fur family iron response transcriptional regulator